MCLAFFGISLPIVRVGGGILVAISGWRLLSDSGQDASIPTQVAKSYDELSDDEFKGPQFLSDQFPLDGGAGRRLPPPSRSVQIRRHGWWIGSCRLAVRRWDRR